MERRRIINTYNPIKHHKRIMKNTALIAALGLSIPALWLTTATGDEKPVKKASVEEKISQAISKDMPKVKPKQKRTLLVFSRTMGYRHKSIGLGKKALAILGKQTGTYDVVISDDLANFEKPQIDTFDAICFLNTTKNVFDGSGDKEPVLKKNLLDFIANGKGFVGIHAASDTFYKWKEYGEMLGGYFDGHPWNRNTDVVIDVEKGMEKNPLVAGIKGGRMSFKEEIYQHREPYDSSKLNILTRLNPELSSKKVKGIKRTDNDFGVSWYKSYGKENKGRVFYCSLGHNDFIYWDPSVLSHYLAGIQYALGDLELPEKGE